MSLNTSDSAVSLDVAVGERVHMELWRQRKRNRDLVPVLNMQEAGVGKKIRGQRAWSLDELRRVADYLGTSIAYLVGESDNPAPAENGNYGLLVHDFGARRVPRKAVKIGAKTWTHAAWFTDSGSQTGPRIYRQNGLGA